MEGRRKSVLVPGQSRVDRIVPNCAASALPGQPGRGTGLQGGAHTSALLSVIQRLLAEHELKLALELLEAIGRSPVSSSKMTVSQQVLQRVLKSFRNDCGKRSSQEWPGLRLLDDACGPSELHSSPAPSDSELPGQPRHDELTELLSQASCLTLSEPDLMLDSEEATSSQVSRDASVATSFTVPRDASLFSNVSDAAKMRQKFKSRKSLSLGALPDFAHIMGTPKKKMKHLNPLEEGCCTERRKSSHKSSGSFIGRHGASLKSSPSHHRSPMEAVLCPMGDHRMTWQMAPAGKFHCRACDREVAGTGFWHCPEHGYQCCTRCAAEPTKSLNQEEWPETMLPEDEDYSTDSDGDQEEEVGWNDAFDDLSLAQVAWLATPSGPSILHPNNLKRVAWDLMALIFILTECITLPLRLCFSISPGEEWFWISTFFFCLDLLLNLTTGYFSGSVLVMRRPWIARHYGRTWFGLDFVSTVPWDMFADITTDEDDSRTSQSSTVLRLVKLGKLMRCLRLIRIMKLNRLMSRLNELDLFNSFGMNFMLSIGKMVVVLGLVCHWAACVFGWMGDPTTFDEQATVVPHDWDQCVPGGPCENGVSGSPWRHRYGLDNFGLATQYLTALHFATGLITGGELTLQPAFWSERIFAVVMMILGLFLCSAMLSQLLVMISRLAEQRLLRTEQLRDMREFMSARKVGSELQAKIRSYLESQAELKRGYGDFGVLNLLSPPLRNELTEHLNKRVIKKHPFFEKLHAPAMRYISLQAVPTIYSPGDIVVDRGHMALSMHFVVRGKLRVEKAMGKKSVYLEAGNWLGDRCLFINTHRSHCVSAVTPSEVLCVQKGAILAVVQEFPFLQMHYNSFHKRVLGGENISLCTICKNYGHGEVDCPKRQHSENAIELPPLPAVAKHLQLAAIPWRRTSAGS